MVVMPHRLPHHLAHRPPLLGDPFPFFGPDFFTPTLLALLAYLSDFFPPIFLAPIFLEVAFFDLGASPRERRSPR